MGRSIGDATIEVAVEELCCGRAVTDSSDQLVSCNQQHTHPLATAETALEKVKEKMKKRAKEETTPIPKIYHEALQEVAQSESHFSKIIH